MCFITDNTIRVLSNMEFDFDLSFEMVKKYDIEKRLDMLDALTAMKFKLFRAKRDKFGKRLHHNYTNLKGEIRRACIIGDFVELDIANSQPLLMAVKYKNEKYLECCQRGIFYEIIYFAATGKQPSEDERDFVKSSIYHLFFCRPDNQTKNTFYEPINKIFPGLMELLYEMKQGFYDDTKIGEEYKDVAKFLQRTESKLFIDGILKKSYKLFPDDIIISVHDSIICPTAIANDIKQLIQETYNKKNIYPKIHTKET